MGRKIRPYKRKKGSLKQKKELDTFNLFTDKLIAAFNTNLNDEKNIRNK